jgi:predicted DNA-binding protein (MmcQ/YjbR family)
MNIEWVRDYCLSLPHTTEKIQWGDNLVFKVGGKIYAILGLEPSEGWLTLKSTPEEAAELVERPGIIRAPYVGRSHWVTLKTSNALPSDEIRALLRRSYDLIFAKLTKKTQSALARKAAKRRRPHRSSG